MQSPFVPGPKPHANLLAAGYFAALIDCTSEPSDPHPEIFDLFSRALTYLRGNAPDARAILHFEKQLTLHLGIFSHDAEPAHALASYVASPLALREKLWNEIAGR